MMRTMRRTWLVLILVAFAGCGGSKAAESVAASTATTTAATTTTVAATTTVPPTTTTTLPPTTTVDPAVVELAADTLLIKKFWRDYSDSWVTVTEGVDFILANEHPDVPVDAKRCRAAYKKGFSDETVLDQTSIERDDGWMDPDAKVVPRGRIYIMKTQSNTFGPAEVHVAILDGHGYAFFNCGR